MAQGRALIEVNISNLETTEGEVESVSGIRKETVSTVPRNPSKKRVPKSQKTGTQGLRC
jgi:hypothetical protein